MLLRKHVPKLQQIQERGTIPNLKIFKNQRKRSTHQMGYFARNYIPCMCTFTIEIHLLGREGAAESVTLHSAGLTCFWAAALLARLLREAAG